MSRRKKDHLRPLEVEVENDNVMAAYRKLHKEMGKEGFIYEMKRREYAKSPGEKAREKRERAERRRREEERRKERQK